MRYFLCWNRAVEFHRFALPEKLGALIYREKYVYFCLTRYCFSFSELKASNEEVIRKQLSRNHYHNNQTQLYLMIQSYLSQ